ncbi:12348_t:CDS:2 [Funneliformis geosporum]|uniref:7652_t:CDS:1 n=1 Tax=Funneliformis geosporum TaxID=1117311 RepID=A0A9W4SQI4_9GLOM|nr:12348_t:CDS:2 [Funneliformis geosporum]CAI2176814.1 7652_t:CDS:2 [Funneliformis geosporum]
MVEIYSSIKTLLTFAGFFVILYYGTGFLRRFVERKFKIHFGSIGFLSIANLSYSGKISGPHQTQHSFNLSVNKIHLQIRKPNASRKTWFTFTIDGAYFNFSSIKIFLQTNQRKRVHARQHSLITAVPQKAWWSSVWVVKYVMGKISSIPLQFFLSVIANYVDIDITNVKLLIEDLGQFQIDGCTLGMDLLADIDNRNHHHVFSKKFLNISFSFSSLSIRDIESVNKSNSSSSLIQNLPNISPAISLLHTTKITLSLHLSPACTSLISIEIDVHLNRINIGIDSILRLVKIIQSKIPNKVKRGPVESLNTPSSSQPSNRSRSFMMANLLDSSLARKMRMSRRKKTPVEFFGSANFKVDLIDIKYEFSGLDNSKSHKLPLTAQLSLNGFSISLKQDDIHSIYNQRRSILFIEEIPKPIKLRMNFSIDDIYGDLVDNNHNVSRMIQVDKIASIMLLSKPLVTVADYDPNSLSLDGTFEVNSPEISVKFEHLDLIIYVIDSLKHLDLGGKQSSTQQSPKLKESCQIMNGIPKLVAICSIINPLVKITRIPYSTRIDGFSQISFGFQDISFEVNGDYTELNDLPEVQHQRVLSRRYTRSWTQPSFSLVYNLVASLKTHNMKLYTFEYDLFRNNSLEFNLATSALGTMISSNDNEDSTSFTTSLETETIQVDVSWIVDRLEVNLCDKSTFDLLKQLIDVSKKLQKDKPKKREISEPMIIDETPEKSEKSLLMYLEVLHCYVSFTAICVKIAGVDSFVNSSTSRGIDFRLQDILFDYKGARATIDPTARYKGFGMSTEDSDVVQHDTGGILRGFVRGIKLIPILAIWDKDLFKNTTPLLNIPDIELQSTLSFKYLQNDYELVINHTVKVQEVHVKYSLLYHYSCLVGAINIVRLLPTSSDHEKNMKKSVPKPSDSHSDTSAKFDLNITVNKINMSIDLPENTKVFARVDGIDYKFVPPSDHGVRIKKLRVFGTSLVEEGLWDEIGRVENTKILLLDDDTKNEKKFDKMIRIQSDLIHVRIPHQFVLADVIENIANTAKAVKHLTERIFTSEESCLLLGPEEEEAKILPTIQLKVGLVTFCIEDDPFEAKLSLIWKIGCLEQKARLGRDAAFEAKAEAIREAAAYSKNNGGQSQKENSGSLLGHEEKTRVGNFRHQPSPRANLSIDAACEALKEYNSKSWIKCVKAADPSRAISMDKVSQEESLPIRTTEPSKFPALFSATILKFLLTLSTPSFPMENLPQYMNEIGKGLPLDTKFALLVPMHLSAKLKEAWVEIRDYPLPLAHIPSTDNYHGKILYSFFLEGNLVVGEELKGMEAIREASVVIMTSQGDDSAYTIKVPRTVSPVKIYSDLHVKINSSQPTVFSWGISMQPAVQHFAKVFESFTKPNPDPSEAIGFWDKMRIMMHVKISMEFKGTGDVQFYAKGSRDPYLVTGHGVGFVLCWSKNVEIRLGHANDQNEVLQVDSEEFTCAIPNLASVVSDGSLSANNTGLKAKLQNESIKDSETSTIRTLNSSNTVESEALFNNYLKRVMKLCGGVRYGMGVHFQRLCNNSCPVCKGQRNCRLTDFIPHYEIITRIPEYATAVSCPINLKNSDDYCHDKKDLQNSIQLSPKSLQHVLSWAFLFEPAMTIPIRQGALFPSLEPPSPKLGKYLGTIKIKICVGPLFLNYFYREDAFEDPLDGRTHIVGIKGKIENFKFDMHLRSEERIIEVEEQEVKARDIILHEAEVDLNNLDLRGIAVRYIEENIFSNFSDEHEKDEREILLGKDEDFMSLLVEDEEWVDDDDYIELDWMLPDVKPGVRVLPLMRSPQMMYFKSPNENDTFEDKKTDQGTHVCVMGQGRDTVQVQIDFLTERLNRLSQEISQQTKILSNIEERITADSKNPNLHLQNMSQSIQNTTAMLSQKRNVIQEYLNDLEKQLNKPDLKYVDVKSDEQVDNEKKPSFSSPLWADTHGHFGHRFIIHNAEGLWNNSLRNLMYKFWNLVEQHQGLTYYMSMSAVKFIRDLQKKIQQQKEKEAYENSLRKERDSMSSIGLDNYDFDAHMAAEMLRKLVGEQSTSFVVPNEILVDKGTDDQEKSKDLHDDIPEGYSLRNDFIVQFINPQINLQCEKNPDSSIIMCIERAQLKTFSIVEDWSKGDLINEVVKTRMFFGLDNAQLFTSTKEDFKNDYYSKILTANNYGAKGQENWPVWVPVEVLISNTKNNALPFEQLVKRTSATAQYDKFNNLRIKGSDIKKDDQINENNKDINSNILEVDSSKKEEFDKRMDSFHINVPNIKISATSDQYCIFFDVVTDLFMYREPAQKERSERLQAVLLAADLDDLEGAAERVTSLQEKIRQLDDIRLQYELHSAELDEEGIKELRAVEVELINSQEELYLLMEAITASQEKRHKADSKVAFKLIATADKVAWVMQENNRKPICEWKLANAHFVLMTKEENSSINTLEIDHLVVINKLPKPTFKELISPYIIDNRPVDFSRNKMIRVYWGELEPVAGIAMVEHFEINMFPLKFQMQYDIGKLIMMYIFPEKRSEYIIKQNSIKANDFAQVGSTPIEQKRGSIGFEQTVKASKKITDLSNDSSSTETQETSSETDVVSFTDDGTSIANNPTSISKKQLSKTTTGDHTEYSSELELMKTRASQNRTFIYIKVPGVTHNFSYQGIKEKNLEDLYDFVFKMPTLEYQNKTWSWLDFLEQFKKDIIRTILAHTGSLINQKFITQKRVRPTTAEPTFSNESKEIAVPSLATVVAAANVTLMMEGENVENEKDDEGSDKTSILSNESQESQKKTRGIKSMKHDKKDSITQNIPLTNYQIHKEAGGTPHISSAKPIPTSSINEDIEGKGRLLLGKMYDETRSNQSNQTH